VPILNKMQYPVHDPRKLTPHVARLLVDEGEKAKAIRKAIRSIDAKGTLETGSGVIDRNLETFQGMSHSVLRGGQGRASAFCLEPARAEILWDIAFAAHQVFLGVTQVVVNDPYSREVTISDASMLAIRPRDIPSALREEAWGRTKHRNVINPGTPLHLDTLLACRAISPLTGWLTHVDRIHWDRRGDVRVSKGMDAILSTVTNVDALVAVCDWLEMVWGLIDVTFSLVSNLFGPDVRDLLVSPGKVNDTVPELGSDLREGVFNCKGFPGLVDAHSILDAAQRNLSTPRLS
jgi:hypothetical protein